MHAGNMLFRYEGKHEGKKEDKHAGKDHDTVKRIEIHLKTQSSGIPACRFIVECITEVDYASAVSSKSNVSNQSNDRQADSPCSYKCRRTAVTFCHANDPISGFRHRDVVVQLLRLCR